MRNGTDALVSGHDKPLSAGGQTGRVVMDQMTSEGANAVAAGRALIC